MEAEGTSKSGSGGQIAMDSSTADEIDSHGQLKLIVLLSVKQVKPDTCPDCYCAHLSNFFFFFKNFPSSYFTMNKT